MSDANPIRFSIFCAALFVASLWSVKLFETVFAWDLYRLGVLPQTLSGTVGILTGPMVHGSWEHLIANSLPTLILGSLLVYGYPKSRWYAFALIWLLAGIGVWLFARENYHFGASGLTHGMFFYLFVGGFLRKDRLSAGLLMIAFYMYGTMVLTILPQEQGISFEYHLFGAIGGVVAAIGFRRWDPKQPRKTYSWDRVDEDEETEDLIGDEWMNSEESDRP